MTLCNARCRTLVLMRHGKARQLEEGQFDFDRPLSEAGRRALAAQLPSMLRSAHCESENVIVISSPATRARQTAELLQEALAAKGVDLDQGVVDADCLWEQDEDTFLDLLDELPYDFIFAVGHNPFVESLASRLTGAALPCSTGGLAGIRLDERSRYGSAQDGSCRLLWFCQGPVSQDWKTLVQLEDAIAGAADTMQARYDAFMADPLDIETMHKLRVSIRTLRSLIAFVKPWQNPKQNKSLQALLKGVVAHTSRQRELDVFALQARQLESASDELVAFCDGKAAEQRERVLEILSAKRVVKALAKAGGECHRVKWKSSVVACGLGAASVRAHFDAMVHDLENELGNLPIADAELTHDIRKRAKRARYAAENFKSVLGDDAIAVAKGMTSHQDDLGALCDARINIQLINEFLAEDVPEPARWDLVLLRAQNESFLYEHYKRHQNV